MENSTKVSATVAEQEAQNAKNEKIRKYVTWGGGAVVGIVAIALIYMFAIHEPGVKKADQAFAQAYSTLVSGNDSLALVQMKQAATLGHDGGELAKVFCGNILYAKKDYAAALEYYKDASLGDIIGNAGVIGKAGDCLAALGKEAEAVEYFGKAVSAAKGNPQLVPYFLQKKAVMYHKMGNAAEEAKAYQEIVDKYPSSVAASDARKYLERAKAAAGK